MTAISTGGLSVLSKPRFQPLPAELVAFVKLHQELIGLEIVELQPESVYAQESGSDRDGRSLVSIDEGMILRKALQQCSRLLDDVPVIAALRAAQSGFKGVAVTNALCPAK